MISKHIFLPFIPFGELPVHFGSHKHLFGFEVMSLFGCFAAISSRKHRNNRKLIDLQLAID